VRTQQCAQQQGRLQAAGCGRAKHSPGAPVAPRWLTCAGIGARVHCYVRALRHARVLVPLPVRAAHWVGAEGAAAPAVVDHGAAAAGAAAGGQDAQRRAYGAVWTWQRPLRPSARRERAWLLPTGHSVTRLPTFGASAAAGGQRAHDRMIMPFRVSRTHLPAPGTATAPGATFCRWSRPRLAQGGLRGPLRPHALLLVDCEPGEGVIMACRAPQWAS
jgi:hypothetical protein